MRVRHKNDLKAALEWYLKRATWNDSGGYSIQGVTLEDIGARQTLNAAIEIETDIPDVLKRRIVADALAQWYISSRHPDDAQSFERALKESAKSLDAKSQPFTVITLWNVRTPQDQAITLRANELSTTIGPWPTVQDFGLDEVWKRAVDFWYPGPPRWLYQAEDAWLPSGPLIPGVTASRAPDWFSAVELVSHSQELIRASLNRPRAMRIGFRFSRLPAPLADVLASSVYAVFAADRHLVDVAYGLEVVHDLPRADLSEAEVAAAGTLLEQIDAGASRPDVARFKSRLLRLYQAALDSTDRQSQFLSFWQVVEAATLTEPNSRDQVESRLVTLLGLDPGSINSHLAHAMAALRHDLVHRGTYPIADPELPFVLKWVADHALPQAFALVDALGGVDELRDYFQYATRGTSDLQRLAKVSTHIVAMRSPPQQDPQTS
jgi:hypothetical protein